MNKSFSSKVLILLTIIAFFTLISIFLIILIFSQFFSQDSETEVTNTDPNSQQETFDPNNITPDNVINIDPTKSENYIYAAINSNDTVSLFTLFGNKLNIQLDNKNWSNLQWNQNSSKLAIEGIQQNEITDLLIYDVIDGTSSWITNFYGTESGVSSYIWGDADTIYFNQGEEINNWMHRYYVPSKSERIKIERIDGEILETSPDGSLLIYKLNSSSNLVGYNLAGKVAWEVSGIVDPDGAELNVTDIYFINADIALLTVLNNDVQSFYRVSVGGNTAVQLIDGDYVPLCTVADNFVLMLSSVDNKNSVVRLNVTTNNVTDYFDIQGNFTLNQDSLSCSGPGKVIFSGIEKFETENSWFIADANQLTELTFLKGAKEVAAVNFSDVAITQD